MHTAFQRTNQILFWSCDEGNMNFNVNMSCGKLSTSPATNGVTFTHFPRPQMLKAWKLLRIFQWLILDLRCITAMTANEPWQPSSYPSLSRSLRRSFLEPNIGVAALLYNTGWTLFPPRTYRSDTIASRNLIKKDLCQTRVP
jgi:hypothetical protein